MGIQAFPLKTSHKIHIGTLEVLVFRIGGNLGTCKEMVT